MKDDKLKDIKKILSRMNRQIILLDVLALQKNTGEELDGLDFVNICKSLDDIQEAIDSL